MSDYSELTQKYSTWGDKLLQHTDVLHSIQVNKTFKPITIQLAPCEICDSDCPFCSVAGRPLKSFMPWDVICQTLQDFKKLGAKSVEITGGGNPMLYRDKAQGKNINDIISYSKELGYDVGMITNSHDLKILNQESHKNLNWLRISLIQLDEGVDPEDYNFRNFPKDKLGFSYIIYDGTEKSPRLGKPYRGTTKETIERIAKLVSIHPEVKFVRIAGNCLIKGNNATIKDEYTEIIKQLDKYSKFFIKDIDNDDGPYNEGCYVGAIRPYIAPHPHGTGSYHVYICTSHVLNTRTYDLDYSLCEVKDIISTWEKMSENYKNLGYPYEIKNNKGKNWCSSCKYCYYKFNNKLLHTVASEMPDKNFP
jgi:hypothetical protein